jgi:branched-chain amino acid transport system ATP-binding protein
VSADAVSATGGALFELEDVHAAYGPYRALFGVSLTVPAASTVALLGPNGAGKSTVARVASGLIPVSAGRIRFEGRDITGVRPNKLVRLGIAHVAEGRSVFATLTVQENLALRLRGKRGRAGTDEAIEQAYAAFPRLAERRSQRAATLSGGEQRMLSLAGALVAPPRLLIVDELSLGLAPRMVDDVYRSLAVIRESGTALLVVEQQVARALSLADHVVVLSKGQVAEQGPAASLSLATSYLNG